MNIYCKIFGILKKKCYIRRMVNKLNQLTIDCFIKSEIIKFVSLFLKQIIPNLTAFIYEINRGSASHAQINRTASISN
jgi:hypothetical protein